MAEPFAIRPHIITRVIEPPMIGAVLMFMACTRPTADHAFVDDGRQLVGEWAYANLAIADGRATRPLAPEAGLKVEDDMDEVLAVVNMLKRIRAIDGFTWNDGWVIQAGGSAIYSWMCERIKRAVPELIDEELIESNPAQAATDATRRYAMRAIKPEGQA